MAMLKLTDHNLGTADGAIYVMAKHIAGMYRYGDWTNIWLVGGFHFEVRETPEEIMAMEAMRLEMDKAHLATYPPMTVASQETRMNLGSNQFPCFEAP